MRKPVVSLLALALLGLPVATAYADTTPTPGEKQVAQVEKERRDKALAQAKKGFMAEATSEVFCHIDGNEPLSPDAGVGAAAAQFSDTGIEAYWSVLKASPLRYVDDPQDVTLSYALNPSGSFPPPAGATKDDTLRQWRFNMCTSAAFRTQWISVLRSQNEKLALGLKPGLNTEAAMNSFYDKKSQDMVKVLDAEQARSGDTAPSVAKVVADKLAVFATEYDEDN